MTLMNYLKFNFYFIIFALFGNSAECLEKKMEVNTVKTSVIVPSHYKHFVHIPELLNYYKNQTVLPDEIIISLSESHKASKDLIQNVETSEWPFLVILLCNESKLSAGQNRNLACEYSSGDVLICQDADDVPHPQRVEIIKYMFENFEIDHLMHCWIPPGNSFLTYQLEELENQSDYFLNFNDAYTIPWLHNGNIALTRSVFKAIKWPEYFQIGEDMDFNKTIYNNFQFKKIVIRLPLLLYRNYLSSFANH